MSKGNTKKTNIQVLRYLKLVREDTVPDSEMGKDVLF